MRKALFLLFAAVGLHAEGTYFCYDDSLYRTLLNLRTDCCMQVADLCKWDEVARGAAQKENLSLGEQVRLFSYLYMAQQEAAILSSKVTGGYVGSLDPLSSQVIALFVPTVEAVKGDAYSEELARLVVEKMKGQQEQEKGWKPWYIECVADYFPPCPPAADDNFWEWQALEIEAAQTPMTRAKRRVVDYWTGKMEDGSGNWRMLANCELFESDPSLEWALEVRAVLMASLYDTQIVGFAAKHEFNTARPTGETVIPVPNNPSYPSLHAAEAGAAATVLRYYYPAEAGVWSAWEQQAADSRIWAGVHYPYDVEAGSCVGRGVAGAVISSHRRER